MLYYDERDDFFADPKVEIYNCLICKKELRDDNSGGFFDICYGECGGFICFACVGGDKEGYCKKCNLKRLPEKKE